jgi:HAD superfamily hydrolase (TIGR01548 family)
VIAALLSELGLEAFPETGGYRLAPFPKATWLQQAIGSPRELFVPHTDDFERLAHTLRTALAPQAILFDMDGVMVDVSGSYRQAIEQTVRDFGHRLEPGEVAAAKREGSCNNDWILTHRLLTRRGHQASLAEVTARFEELYQGTAERPGLRSTERLLSERAWLESLPLPLAVVTGRPRADCQRLLDEHGLSHLFAVLVCMEDGPAKPDPAPVRRAMQELGVERAWMLGDTVDDMRAAQAAGAIGLGLLAPGDDPAATKPALIQAGAARVLESLQELETIL